MNETVQSLLQRCKTLPTLPAVASDIVRVCEREDADIQQLSELVNKDTAIAAKLLSVAQSPAQHQA